ncbi:molybdenum cofactor cytidylyltransferase [Granulicella rosea]|uniref:Molybdenum cofactor cytidylyltransferase n=2 Tax=Granulicella rosea TaxID=474952 RepID=A0A239KUT9_9BACT|nr:molybdenum cofactor cytidylyltransferase [Granulicella rosea]
MGSPKQLAMLAGETLLDRAVRTAHAAGCAPVVVVLGAAAEEIQAACRLDEAHIVLNPVWAEGMASSLRTGLEQLAADAVCAVVMTCDQPAVTAEHLRRLMLASEGGTGVACSGYGEVRGVPACFPATTFAALKALAGDAGARKLLASARVVSLLDGELDVDTPEALDEARKILG